MSLLPRQNLAQLITSLKDRKFSMSLNPSAIGVSVSQGRLFDYVLEYGFEAMAAVPSDLRSMTESEAEAFQSKMSENNISWDAAGLPVQFRATKEEYKQGLEQLKLDCQVLRRFGAKRMNTWIMPTHSTLTYRQNFHLHTSRMIEISKILADYDITLGLEYVGPKTLMARDKYSFIRTFKEMRELIEAIGSPNVAYQLDSFHTYCAQDDLEELSRLSKDQIVTVDLNDAKAGRSPDQQIDNERELPGASGLIDLKAFLEVLLAIGYDGPVRAEPFNQVLNNMDNDQAVAATYDAMAKTFELVR